jgi:hypothetical protein
MKIGKYTFEYICDIVPRLEDGKLFKHNPASRYQNRRKLNTHKHGDEQFCHFKILNDDHAIRGPGVYAIIVEGETKYIGRCVNLKTRFNAGYGQISPRNCYKGGQTTNCRINKIILDEAEANSRIQLYYHETANHKAIEQDLLTSSEWDWNIQGSSNNKSK